jgi:ATP synthase protein I
MKRSRPPADAERLGQAVERQSRLLRRAERERRGVLANTAFLGTLGLVFVLPVVAGAYLGRWIDEALPGYSIRWTLSFMALGMVIGAANVYFLFRDVDGRH